METIYFCKNHKNENFDVDDKFVVGSFRIASLDKYITNVY
jgi:hypothetical protein